MTKTTLALAACALTCALTSACATEHQPGVHAVAAPPAPSAPWPARGPAVPAGTLLRVKMNEPLGSSISKRGERFTATVVDPVRAADGRVLVPAGAVLDGTVAGVTRGRHPGLRLRFDAVQTTAGPAAVDARIDHVETAVYPAAPTETGTGSGVTPSPSAFARRYFGPASDADSWFGATSETLRPEIRVPVDATVVLELTEPLLPGSA